MCIVYASRTSQIKFSVRLSAFCLTTVRITPSGSLHSNDSVGTVHDVNCDICVIIAVGEVKASYLEL
jgi:hypothetical protein